MVLGKATADLRLEDLTEQEIVDRMCNFLEYRLPRQQEDLYALCAQTLEPVEKSRVRNPKEVPILAFAKGLIEMGYLSLLSERDYRNKDNTERFVLGETKWLQDAIDDAVGVYTKGNPSSIKREEYFQIKDSIFNNGEPLRKRFGLYWLLHEVAIGVPLIYDFDQIRKREKDESIERKELDGTRDVPAYTGVNISA